MEGNAWEQTLRDIAFCTLLILVVRIIIYMGCHPRIAVLKQTILESVDDIFHFVFVFGIIYIVFAFAAYWVLGAEPTNSEFSTLTNTCWTQMRMLCGDFPFTRHPTVLNAIYMITFIIVVFIMALNFLLAVIVGAFDRVKEAVEICLVEDNVFVDAWYSFIYFYHRFTKGLPSRRNVSLALALGEGDEKMTEEKLWELVHPQTGERIFKTMEHVKLFSSFYQIAVPEEEVAGGMLLHSVEQRRLNELAEVTRLGYGEVNPGLSSRGSILPAMQQLGGIASGSMQQLGGMMGGMAKDAMGGMGGIIGMKKGASAPHSPTPDNGPTPDNRTTPDNGNSVDDAARKREEERKKFLKQKVLGQFKGKAAAATEEKTDPAPANGDLKRLEARVDELAKEQKAAQRALEEKLDKLTDLLRGALCAQVGSSVVRPEPDVVTSSDTPTERTLCS